MAMSEADGAGETLAPASGHVKQYQRQKLTAHVASTVATLFWLGLMAFVLAPLAAGPIREDVGDNCWAQLVVMALVVAASLEAVTLPIDFYSSYVVEHQHRLSTQTIGSWIRRRLKSYVVGGAIGLGLLCGLYAMLWKTGAWWWLWAAGGWLLVTLVMGQLLPVVVLPLFYAVDRLDDASLLARLRRRCEGTGLTVEGIYRLHLSGETRKANAALAGLGRTRRVLLGDTLLDAFAPEEIEVVFAHEVGHHVYGHLIKGISLRVFLAIGGLWLADRALATLAERIGYAGMDDPFAAPLTLFVLSAVALVLTPLQNAVSRRFETQCDRYALETTGLREAYRGAFAKLARMNKSDPDPHPLAVWFFYDHPPIRARLALAEGAGALGGPGEREVG